MNPLNITGFALFSYFLGAIPVGFLIARVKNIDIRTVGSGNIGATNVFRFIGKAWGITTFILDALKGFVPAFLLPMLVGTPPHPFTSSSLGLLFGCAAIAGHNWPVYLKFKGGKGVATSAGVLLGVAPLSVAVGMGVWTVLMLMFRYVSVGSMGASLAIVVMGWMFYREEGYLIPAVLTVLGLLIIFRHRSNLQRLLQGTENKVSFVRKKNEST